jgi:hypothetical protein
MHCSDSSSHRCRQAVISAELWAAAKADLREAKSGKERKKKNRYKKKPSSDENVHFILHFTYSLHDGQFVGDDVYSVKEVSNLYFQYAAAATNEDVSNDYIVVLMADDDGTENPNEKGPATAKKADFKSYNVDPLREMILRNGILVHDYHHDGGEDARDGVAHDVLFHFIGCSNSQVQRHCYIFRRSATLRENESRLLHILPDLDKLEKKKGIPKRVKYAGLLFSGLITSVKLPRGVIVEEIRRKRANNFDFTDGPGLISRKLALWVKGQLGIKGGDDDCPSIFQIRYCGRINRLDGNTRGFVCKGVLVVDPTNIETYMIQVRESLLKIEASRDSCNVLQDTLGICDYGRPSPGRLGQQLICLLSGTVERSDFIKLQNEHLDCVKNALHDPFSMAWVAALDRNHVWKSFHELILFELKEGAKKWDGQESLRKCADLLGHGGSAKLKKCQKPTKAQLPLAASRTLFGAALPELLHDYLNEGDCVVLLEDGPLFDKGPHHKDDNTREEKFVIVSRSPSYHPGDIRVLRVVCLPEGHPVRGMSNCILFSTKGERPDPDKMGGGDLDGDKFLVVWHPIL